MNQAPRNTPPPHPFTQPPQPFDDTSSWWRDLLRMVAFYALISLVIPAALWSARWGVLIRPIDDLGTFAALLTAMYGSLLPLFMLRAQSTASTFRRSGLLPFVFVSATIGAVLLTALSSLWPWLAGFTSERVVDLAGRAPAGLLHTGSLFLTTAFIGATFFFLIRVFPFPRARAWLSLAGWIISTVAYVGVALVIGSRPVSLAGSLFMLASVAISAGLCALVITVVLSRRGSAPGGAH